MTTRAATMASAISNRMRQIRDRSHPATRARSASRVASRIYATATVIYLDAPHRFTAKFTDESLLVVEPGGPAVPRGRAKTDALARAHRLPAHSPTQLSDSAHYDAIHGHVWLHPRLRPCRPAPPAVAPLRRGRQKPVGGA